MRQRYAAGFAVAAMAIAVVGPAAARTDGPTAESLRASLLQAHRASGETFTLDQRLAGREHMAGTTVVVVQPRFRRDARAAVRRAGGRVEAAGGGLLQAVVPNRTLLALSRDRAVRRIRPPARPVPLAVPGEGVVATNASAWHAVGVTGTGSKVAIIDTGFGGLAADQAAGEIPASAVAVDFCSGTLDGARHGTAVAEIVAEEAPGAQLYLLCIDSEVTLAQAEAYAKQVGADVISMSIAFFNTWRGDGRGPEGTPDAVVADARRAGILWVNGAGNEALNHWSGPFNDVQGVGVHSFTPWGDTMNTVRVPGGDVICAFLRWDDWPTSTEDYDLGLYDENARRYVARSTGDQRGLKDPPVEAACYATNAGPRTLGIIVSRASGTGKAPSLDLFIEGIPFNLTAEYRSAERSVADPATSPNAIGVGAICWQSAGLEPYSSQGPTIDGRVKPDLVAPDAVSSATYGNFSTCGGSGFSGTSAAAPHVAGAAALVKQAYPSFDAAQLKQYLVSHAADLGAAGPDNLFGAGRLLLPPPDLPPTVQALAALGKRGARIALRFRVSDDHGEARERLTVTRGAAVVASLAVPFASAPQAGAVHAASWHGATRAGAYRFCVVATDRGGNASERSCAAIRLR